MSKKALVSDSVENASEKGASLMRYT